MAEEIFIGNDLALVDTEGGADLSISLYGDLELFGDQQDIVQTAVNNMRTILGEWFIDSNCGNDIYNKRLRNNQNGYIDVVTCCKQAIMYDIRVKEITRLDVVYMNVYDCAVRFTLKLIDDREVNGDTVLLLKEVFTHE